MPVTKIMYVISKYYTYLLIRNHNISCVEDNYDWTSEHTWKKDRT